MAPKNQVSEAQLLAMAIPCMGVQYTLDVCFSPPARKVGRKRRRNLILDVPMTRLGVALQAESLSGEFLFLLELDRREDVVAVFDQPITVPLVIVDSAGRKTRTTYTADYLVVDATRIIAYEIKADHELEDLCRRRPSDWRKDDSGYHYLPAIDHFERLGIEHITIACSSLSPIRGDNLRLLACTRQCIETKRLRRTRHLALQIVRHEGAIKAGEILDRLEEVDATAILQLINQELIFADLDHASLSDIREIWVATSQSSARLLQQSGQQLACLLRSRTHLEPGELIDPRYYAEVASRLANVTGSSDLSPSGKRRSTKMIARYKKKFSVSGGDPLSLVPAWARCGNHDPRISQVHQSFIAQSTHIGRSDNDCPTPHKCYQQYTLGFEQFRAETGLLSEFPIARSTYYLLWDKTGALSQDAERKGGRRLRNAQSDVYDPSSKTIIATRSFAVAHIDHWKADLFVVVGYIHGKKISKRPWLTAMVDAHSGEVLALWLSFAAPSRKSCAMVIRDCVRRHGRLELLVVDGGAEFKSVHFSVMLATFGVIRCERPPEDPRFGQEVERLFGHFKDRFAKGLPGFGLSIEQARAVSGSMKTHRHAKLSLLDAFSAIEAYTFRGYNFGIKPGERSSRTDIRSRAMSVFPWSGRLVEWSLKFLIATSIEAPAAHYTLWNGRGVHVYGRWYSSPALLVYRGYKKDITVRIEPHDSAVIYVCIEGRWLVCAHSSSSLHAALSDRRLISEASEFHDLRAIRKELSNEMDREAAEIVTAKLEEISSKNTSEASSESHLPSKEGDSQRDGGHGLSFDEIEPLDESDEF